MRDQIDNVWTVLGEMGVGWQQWSERGAGGCGDGESGSEWE